MNTPIKKLFDSKNLKIFVELSFIFIFLVCLSYIKFSDFFISNGKFVIGDNGDPRYSLFLFEHIYQSISNNIFNIFSPPIFHPYKWTIALADWMIFPGFFHAFFRILGIDLFNSFQYSLILSNSLFFIFSYIAIRNISRINRIFSLYFAIFVSYGRFLFEYRFWLQNFMIFLAPLLFLFLFGNFETYGSNKFKNYLKKYRNLISGMIIMLSLFSVFYIGASLLLIVFLNFIFSKLISFKKEISIKDYFLKNIFSKEFFYLFSPSLLFIIFNIPGILIADVSDISTDLERINISNNGYYSFVAIFVFLGWLDIFIKRFFLKRRFDSLNKKINLLLIITIPFLIYLNVFPNIFGFNSDNYFLSINQIYSYKFGTLFRDHNRFFYPIYLLSIIFACTQIKTTISDLITLLKKFNKKYLIKSLPIFTLILLMVINRFENKFIFFKYTHKINVPAHKAMLLDAKKQLSDKNKCKSFYLESYNNYLQLNGLSAHLIAVTSKVPTLNGYTAAYPKDWPLRNNSGFYNQDYINNINKLIKKENLDSNTICKIEYRKPPFQELLVNEKTAKYVYSDENIENIDFEYSEIEKKGKYKLLKDQFNGYWVEDINNTKLFLIKNDFGIKGISYESPLRIIAAEKINGNNRLLVYNNLNTDIEVWEVDEKWKLVNKLENIKTMNNKLPDSISEDFGVKINFAQRLIDQSGNHFLIRDQFGTFFAKENYKNKLIPIMRDSHIVGSSKTLPPYNLVGIEEINGIKKVVDYTPFNKHAYIWEVDSNFNFIRDLKVIRGEDEEFFQLEKQFKLDINKDGFIGNNLK